MVTKTFLLMRQLTIWKLQKPLIRIILSTQTAMDTSSGERSLKGGNYASNGRIHHQNGISIKDLNNSYPVEMADYAVANQIDQEPEFS